MKKPTILFYCQHLLGVGHVTRSLAICNGLLNNFNVIFVQGGPKVGKTIQHDSFTHIYLAPLLMREADSSLYDPNGERDIESIFADRKQTLAQIATSQVDVVLTELYPFGRGQFKPEILGFIDEVKKHNPHAKVATSVRDILVEKQNHLEREKKIVKIINNYYDYVLVHSDENFIKLNQTFSSANEFAEKIVYTGFVCESPKNNTAYQPDNTILVSMGGGAVGSEMVQAVLNCTEYFPEYHFKFAVGPYAPQQLRDGISQKQKNSNNVNLIGFLNNFEDELIKSTLSISLGGYNTVMNVLNTKANAMIYPYMGNIEQSMRAVALEKEGMLKVFYAEDLQTEKLVEIIKDRLSAKMSDFPIQIDGAQRTSEIIKNWF